MGFTDDWYTDGRVLSMRPSVIIVPTDFIAFTDGMSPSVKMVNGVVHVHDRVENVVKHVIFYVHDVKVMAKEIGILIRKLPKNTLLYLVMGQTKTRKLLLTGLETKHNVIVF